MKTKTKKIINEFTNNININKIYTINELKKILYLAFNNNNNNILIHELPLL